MVSTLAEDLDLSEQEVRSRRSRCLKTGVPVQPQVQGGRPFNPPAGPSRGPPIGPAAMTGNRVHFSTRPG